MKSTKRITGWCDFFDFLNFKRKKIASLPLLKSRPGAFDDKIEVSFSISKYVITDCGSFLVISRK